MKAKLFRLKKEACQFYDSKLSREIKSLENWRENHVHENALEETEKIFISFGIPTSEMATDLCGWSSRNNTASFHFSINVIEVSNNDYEDISKNENIRMLMDRIQSVANEYFN